MNRSVDINRLTNMLFGVARSQVEDSKEIMDWFGPRLNLGVRTPVGIPTYDAVKEEIGG